MLYPFFYNTKWLLDVVKEFCTNETKRFIETGDEKDMLENMKEIVFEMTAYFKKYHKFLEAACDNPFILL